MKRRTWLVMALNVLAATTLAVATANSRQTRELKLKLVPLQQGLSESQGFLDKEIEAARQAEVDLYNPNHPLIAYSYKNGRLFYLFYKTAEQAQGSQDYLIQRIRKTERFYTSSTDSSPQTRQTFLVEAFKLKDGKQKRADQHFGSYGISNYYKREVIKEYEIGFGQISGVASGVKWPFEDRILYKLIQGYSPQRNIYERVVFTHSIKWKLIVVFDKQGKYSIQSPEFGFNAPTKLPKTY